MKKILLIFLIIIASGTLFWTIILRDLKITGEANLSWNQSADANVAGYKIYYGVQPRKGDCPLSGGYAHKIDAGKVTAYRIGNLEDKKTYYFSVTSYDKEGRESCFSEEMQKNVNLSMWEKARAIFKK